MTSPAQLPKGNLLGSILLVAGCCIGAGMLGLPVLSALAGFIPTTILFFVSWLFMVCTGLLLLEVNLWFKNDVSIISMADKTLGLAGKIIGWVGFLFLFYTLMVAYIEGTGELIADFVQEYTGHTMPAWIGSVFVAALFGLMVYLGTHAVDLFNRIFMAGLIVSYAFLITLGASHIDSSFLKHSDWKQVYLVIPAMIISFGYHNLIPTLSTYLQGNLAQLRLTIIIGSSIPLLIYLLWEWLILGIVPVETFRTALDQGDMATRALKNAIGSSWVTDLAHYFAFFAIVTSFLGVALSFVDFLADGLHIKKNNYGKIKLCLLVIALPLVFVMIYPKLFLLALRYAGSFGALLLFGVLPAAMVWSGRYYKKINGKVLVPGGRFTLALVIALSFAIMLIQVVNDLK